MLSARAKLLAAATGVVLAWAAWDLYAPRSHSLRDFQPDEVGRLETAMWKSYYAHERLPLFSQLATLLRRQYGLPILRSYVVAYHAARAAVVFQRGHSHADYELALPEIVKFYTGIRSVSSEDFDVRRAARRELDWWIIHRERGAHPPEDLDRSLAALQAELYHLPVDQLTEHARLRADATRLCDSLVDKGNSTEQEWTGIERVLCSSWRSLWQVVNAAGGGSITKVNLATGHD
jgi:hypothetical protein